MGSSVQGGSQKLATPEQLRPFLELLRKHNVKELDTARVYNGGKSEELLGEIPEAQKDFDIATKAPGFSPGSLTYDKVIENANASLAALKMKRIPLYYFHGPDRQTSLEESCRAINDLHQQGKIERFGISNFRNSEVEECYDVCKNNGWVLPTVYQGGYNPLSRTGEKQLFPVLRKLGISFYAYSPLAAGFFSRTTEQHRNPPAGGRYDQMKFVKDMFVNETTLKLHDMLTEACEKQNLALKEATLRFMMHHSALGPEDGVILGASSVEQMEENLAACEGGVLPESVVAAFESLWTQYTEAGYDPSYCV
ncbi:uncharacterized protein MYCFIDRAFT_26489 [Pseudocercospora fijiensis CIRAD86]|uniref:NADP-dependent oxidoreductase domain-containing protein n=1 Tax=Pseudocercospora fijiensis (strain CIRAD86) TaxID=383855 RepID=N1Q8A2_PSEFD|nr:uncharacterized protein MYCFIDRAFT_26489 [Pseudocercospora fijiensis CIRAD86]EME88036.1 hypothetical protein MYCFIDRAFT_26489 [Pseudocercospora fijiensis CIRAD86]